MSCASFAWGSEHRSLMMATPPLSALLLLMYMCTPGDMALMVATAPEENVRSVYTRVDSAHKNTGQGCH